MMWVALRGSKAGDSGKAAAEEDEEKSAGDAADEAEGEDEEIAIGEETAADEETTTGEEIATGEETTEQAAEEQQQQQEEQEDAAPPGDEGLKSEFIIFVTRVLSHSLGAISNWVIANSLLAVKSQQFDLVKIET